MAITRTQPIRSLSTIDNIVKIYYLERKPKFLTVNSQLRFLKLKYESFASFNFALNWVKFSANAFLNLVWDLCGLKINDRGVILSFGLMENVFGTPSSNTLLL